MTSHPLPAIDLGFRTLGWEGEIPGLLSLLEQTLLPSQEMEVEVASVPDLVEAIQRLVVRGAPALGCAGAYGMVLGVQHETESANAWLKLAEKAAIELTAARPTAVNLGLGAQRMLSFAQALATAGSGTPIEWSESLLEQARAFHLEDQALCLAIGKNGAELLNDSPTVLTHCNAGALATGGIGTALGVVYAARALGKNIAVFADETRPLLQGARITAWELQRAGIPVTLQCDSAAASALAAGKIDAVVVGSDRIAANGDVANKIGTYPLAVLAREHGVPFYVAAPTTTVDMQCPSGAEVPIELRDPEEIAHTMSTRLAPAEISSWNPAFDITPAKFVTAIITERGVVEAPNSSKMAAHMA